MSRRDEAEQALLRLRQKSVEKRDEIEWLVVDAYHDGHREAAASAALYLEELYQALDHCAEQLARKSKMPPAG